MIIHVLKNWQSYVVGFISLFAMWLLRQYPTMWGTILITFVWLVLLSFIFFTTYKKNSEKWVYAIGGLLLFFGSLGLYYLIEQRALQYFLAALHAALFGFYVYIPTRLSAKLAHEFKPWRRMLFVTLTFGLFGCISTGFGFIIFFQVRQIALYLLLLALLSALVALVSLRLYHKEKVSAVRNWSFVVGILSFEILIALSYTSFGYLVQGALFTWFWYLIVLFIRFHISTRGIDWQKQQVFISLNIIAFLLLLQLIKWF